MPSDDKVRALLFTGENNHRNWPETSGFLRQILEETGEFSVEPYGNPQIFDTDPVERYDLLISNFNRHGALHRRYPRLTPEQERGLLAFAAPEKGVVIFHAANNAFPGWDEFEQMTGLLWREGTYHPPYGPYRVTIEDHHHPVTEGVSDFDHADELYSNLWRHPQAEIHVLATAVPETGVVAGQRQPLVMTLNYRGGRIFHQALGHDVAAMQNLNFIRLTVQGVQWAAGRR